MDLLFVSHRGLLHNAVATRSLAGHRPEGIRRQLLCPAGQSKCRPIPKARQPKGAGARLRIVRFSGPALTEGIGLHRVEGVQVAVYNPAKTVVDCFKFRRKIGLDVALEALRESWRQRRADMDELWHFAKICRVANVMRPYLESLE